MIYKFVCFALLLFLVNNVSADDSFQWGIAPYFGSFVVNDPEGKSKTSNEFYLFNLVSVFETNRDRRIWAEAGQIKFETSPGVTTVSQKVKQFSFTGAYQFRYRFSKTIKPWFGIGAVLAQSEYQNRFLTDTDGFFVAEFENRKETEIGYALQIQQDFKIRSVNWNAGFTYVDTLNDGLGGYKIHVAILF